MVNLLKKYWLAFSFSFIIIILTFCSTWVKEVFELPDIAYKFFTILLYIPFILIIIWKIKDDILNIQRNIKKPANILYYSFAIYYIILSLYRFITANEVKENLYYTIILFGSLALYLQLKEKMIKTDNVLIQKNILIISLIMVLYRIICYFLVGPVFASYPINMNIMTGVSVVALPFLIDYLKQDISKKTKSLISLVICLTFIAVLTSSARLMCFLTFIVLIVMLFNNIKNKIIFKRILALFLCAILIVSIMFIGNVKNTRYAVYREFVGLDKVINLTDNVLGSNIGVNDFSEEQEKVESIEQINRSDSMRQDLMNMGIEQVKQNPIFGTGNVTYSYFVSGYFFKQSSHNFLIEALVCYGIIGVLFLIIFIFIVISKSKIFSHKNKLWEYKISTLLVFIVYFAMGSWQPLTFNILVCPMFLLIFLAYEKIIKESLQTISVD